MAKPKRIKCDKTKNQFVTKLKDSNCDKPQKLKFLQNFDQKNKKNLTVTKLKNQIVTTLKNSNCDKTQKLIFEKSQKLKL